MSFGSAALLFVATAVARAAPAPVEPLPPASGAPPAVGSLIYVKDLDHLTRIVSSDADLRPRALDLQSRIKLGVGVLMGGAAVGALIVVAAATVFTQTECIQPAVPAGFDLPVSPICQEQTNAPLAITGMMTMVVGGLTGLLLMPARGDLLDIVNTWNTRHPEQTLLLPDSPRSD